MGNTNVKPHPKPRNKKLLRWKAADRPSIPGKPSQIEHNGSIPDTIHIGWTKPEKDGSSTVTSYLVEHKRLGTSHWLKSSQQPTTTNELHVSGLESGWRYQFRVRAQNAVGLSDYSEISEPYTVSLQRSAIAAPKFTQELQDTVILEGDKLEFEVHFLGQPLPNICWFKDGFEIFSGNRTRVTTTSDKSVLTILHATASDEGEIKCTATNRAGHASTKSKLTIEAPPSIELPKLYQDQDGILFEIGETIKLNVTVNGRPTPLIFWSHDGESIQNDDRYEIEYNDKIASVKIENALRSDRGEYQIKAVNKLGQDQASFLVTITDKPTAPGRARVLLTSGRSVTLSWTTPKDDGGSRIGNYIIEYYRMGWDVWLKAATTRQHSTMLGDLIEGSQYKFRVKAESPYGVSEPSEESEVVVIPETNKEIQNNNNVQNGENDSRIPLSKRRRANSTPRVSFILNEDVPVRPERKKTGKTPEASPRMKRRQFNTLTKSNLGSEPSLNRKFSFPYSVAQTNTPYRKGPQTSWDNSLVPNFLDNNAKTTSLKVEKNKSPSPEIIITDADTENHRNISKQTRSPSRSPKLTRGFFEDTRMLKHNNSQISSKSSENSQKSLRSTSEGPNSSEKSPSRSINNELSALRRSPAERSIHIEKSPPRSPNIFKKSPSGSPDYEKSPPRSPEATTKSPPRSTIEFKKSPSLSPNRFQPSTLEKTYSKEKSPAMSSSRTSSSSNEDIQERSKNQENKFKPTSPTRSPQEEKRELAEDLRVEKQNTMNNNSQNLSTLDRIRPTLTHQAFSGSSEFMLVLCPEGEQGTRFQKFGIRFDENSIPPPLSLSAPELGIEPPELPSMKRSASSTELLTYHLMERLHEAVMSGNDARREDKANATHSIIPTIQVNSEPAKDTKEETPSLNRRLSGVLPHNQSEWPNRRYSLKNAKDMTSNFGTKLHKFEETDEMRREVSEYRKISESEVANDNDRTDLVDEDEWLKDYEESVSEEESERSSPDERNFSMNRPRNDVENDDEEIYNPRMRMMSAVKADDNQPFEILTVRKNPPNSNIVPKPILKKTSNGNNSQLKPTNKNDRDQIPKRNRSLSLTEDELDVSQLKISPKPNKRRSFSLIPTQANLIKEAFKNKNQKTASESTKLKTNSPKKVSALASFTSIAGAGFIIPNEMQEKKETEEEAKVVVDFYGDIVKSFGGKSKPTAEFSRSVVSKYDTYEERKISEIKANSDFPPSQNIWSTSQKKPEPEILDKKPIPTPINITRPKQEQSTRSYGMISPSFKSSDIDSQKFPRKQEEIKLRDESNTANVNKNDSEENEFKAKITTREADEILKQMRDELSESKLIYKPPNYNNIPSANRHFSNIERKTRERKRSGRPGSRQGSLVGRRKKTPMSRDASTSPIRFSDDWDSQCSSKNSLEHDYYGRGSLTSSRASSLSRRSLSPPRNRLRGITTQTSFRIESVNPAEIEQRKDLVKKAEDRVSFMFGYFTDAAMVGVAAWIYIFQSEFLAVPFIVIPIYRQLDQQIKQMKEGIKKRLPLWIRKRFDKNR